MKSVAAQKKCIINHKQFLKSLYENSHVTKSIRRATLREILAVFYALKAVSDGKVPLKKNVWDLVKKHHTQLRDLFKITSAGNGTFNEWIEKASQKEKENFRIKNLKIVKLFLSAYFTHGS